MIQHLAAQGEAGRESGPRPAYPRPRSRRPIHPVTCRTALTRRQPVTQPAAPPPPVLPTRTQRPNGAGVSSKVDRGASRPGEALPQSLINSSAQFPFRAGETQRPPPLAPSAHLLLIVSAVSLARCVTQHPEKSQTL